MWKTHEYTVSIFMYVLYVRTCILSALYMTWNYCRTSISRTLLGDNTNSTAYILCREVVFSWRFKIIKEIIVMTFIILCLYFRVHC